MRLSHLTLSSFRAHELTEVAPTPGVNLLVGPNGAGKTNLLEAIGYLCLGKSFLGASDTHVLRRGDPHFQVEGQFESDRGTESRLRLASVPGEGKRAFANGAPLERLAKLVGRAPVVVMSPDDRDLTAGGPVERRRFLDATLSQSSPVYLDDLLKYRRALRQRNALLQQRRKGGSFTPGTMEAWDEELATLAARVVERRRTFLDAFAPRIEEADVLIGSTGGSPTLRYRPSSGEPEPDDLDAMRRELARTRRRSMALGRTLVGPHLDEVVFQIDGFDLRPFASQGQHRTFALIVRIAQALYLRERTEERPLLLLDDVFGTLDSDRTQVVLDMLVAQTLGQSFVTAARAEPFDDVVPFDGGTHAAFHVERGTVRALSSSIPLSS